LTWGSLPEANPINRPTGLSRISKQKPTYRQISADEWIGGLALLLDSTICPDWGWRCALASFRYRAPKTDDDFEEFCLALYKSHLALPGLTRYGRRGQRQHGIDIIDLESPPPYVAIQCKAEDLEAVYPEKRLRAEVDKALTGPFKLKRYIVLTTSKTSTELQIAISSLWL
jgi:hypothetical protein